MLKLVIEIYAQSVDWGSDVAYRARILYEHIILCLEERLIDQDFEVAPASSLEKIDGRECQNHFRGFLLLTAPQVADLNVNLRNLSQRKAFSTVQTFRKQWYSSRKNFKNLKLGRAHGDIFFKVKIM